MVLQSSKVTPLRSPLEHPEPIINYINRVKVAGSPEDQISKPKSKAEKEKKDVHKAIAQLQAEVAALKTGAPQSPQAQAVSKGSKAIKIKEQRREKAKAAALQGSSVDSESDSDSDSITIGDTRRKRARSGASPI